MGARRIFVDGVCLSSVYRRANPGAPFLTLPLNLPPRNCTVP